ncbi:acyltransferase family protein [Rothia nasimurium]|uniref:acyltransferase family protein n=1 Tax=Rothia nasimurium TaxID=85336 RepID=UPI002DD682CE|nr:acyltransferase family protein [Rothia nasimurium]
MDLLRGLAILLIFLQHSQTFIPIDYRLNVDETILSSINFALSPYRVPLLLILSGILLERSLKKDKKTYIEGKIRLILYPFIIWTFVAYVVRIPYAGNFFTIQNFFNGNPTWYLITIFLCYLIALVPFLKNWLIMPLIMLSTLFLLKPDEYSIAANLWFCSFFFIGSALSSRISYIQKNIPLLAIIALGAVFAGSVTYHLIHGYIEQNIPTFITTVLGAIFIIWLAPYLTRYKIAQPLIWIGQRSIIFYVTHAPIIFVLGRLIYQTNIDNYYIIFIIFFIFSITTCWIIANNKDKFIWLYEMPKLKK